MSVKIFHIKNRSKWKISLKILNFRIAPSLCPNMDLFHENCTLAYLNQNLLILSDYTIKSIYLLQNKTII